MSDRGLHLSQRPTAGPVLGKPWHTAVVSDELLFQLVRSPMFQSGFCQFLPISDIYKMPVDFEV